MQGGDGLYVERVIAHYLNGMVRNFKLLFICVRERKIGPFNINSTVLSLEVHLGRTDKVPVKVKCILQ